MVKRDEQGRLAIPEPFRRPRRPLPADIGKEWADIFDQVWYRLSVQEWRDHLERAAASDDLLAEVQRELDNTPDLTTRQVPVEVQRALMDAWFGPREGASSRLLQVPLVLEPQPDGGYVVTSPALPGLITEGETVQEAIANAEDACTALLEGMGHLGQPLPVSVRAIVPGERVLIEAVVGAR
jgi:antitoxin HicB